MWNVGGYGIYAEDGEQGVIDHMYVSGAADAAYYVGECKPCRATIAHVVAKLSAVGYSGTNSTGVVIRDSLWDRNGAGLLPNTYANEALAPQTRTTILRNTVTNSGLARCPDPHSPCRLHRDRDRRGRRQREHDQPQPRAPQRAVWDRDLPHRTVRRVRPGHA